MTQKQRGRVLSNNYDTSHNTRVSHHPRTRHPAQIEDERAQAARRLRRDALAPPVLPVLVLAFLFVATAVVTAVVRMITNMLVLVFVFAFPLVCPGGGEADCCLLELPSWLPSQFASAEYIPPSVSTRSRANEEMGRRPVGRSELEVEANGERQKGVQRWGLGASVPARDATHRGERALQGFSLIIFALLPYRVLVHHASTVLPRFDWGRSIHTSTCCRHPTHSAQQKNTQTVRDRRM